MKKRLLIFILFSLMALSSFTILKCGGGDGGGNGNGDGDDMAKWGSAIWGQSTWNP
jgi:hypothetical protein